MTLKPFLPLKTMIALVAVPFAAGSGEAQLLSSCLLTLSTGGTLVPGATGTMLSSQGSGGGSAVMAVVGTLVRPTLTFSAPSLTGPAASIGGAVTQLAYSSPGGASRGFSEATYSYTASGLIDTLTVDARVTSSRGFVSGTYGVSTTVTCSQ